MAKLGYTDSLKNLSAFKAECFSVISNKLLSLEAEQSKKERDKYRNKSK